MNPTKNSATAHTALPWTAEGHYIHAKGTRFIAVSGDLEGGTAEANAALIVRAVNSHAELVEALKEAHAFAQSISRNSVDDCEGIEAAEVARKCKRAIAKAEAAQ